MRAVKYGVVIGTGVRSSAIMVGQKALRGTFSYMSKKVVIASVRLPVTVTKVDGELQYVASSGGLATGVDSVEKSKDSMWVGWPGISSSGLSEKEKQEITTELHTRGCHPVFLDDKLIDEYYYGYCNATLWPLFHYFNNTAEFADRFWESYKEANRLFAIEMARFATKDALLWVHDYQLMLLPAMLRKRKADAIIGFFLHTPFPSFEIFRLLPEREELLSGVLGANMVGFHTYDYVRHFLSSVLRLLGMEDYLGAIKYEDRFIQADAFPIGIDYKKFSKGARKLSVKKIVKGLNLFKEDTKVILSVDRMDYSKGIPARLKAYEKFLRDNPKYIGKVNLVMIAVPSRGEVEAYKELRRDIEQRVSRINGMYSTNDWSPIKYRYQSVAFDELSALYSLADVMLVTPHRDGMNLVSKEYVASKHKGKGVLVLSEMAGVASELPEAVMVNPSSSKHMSEALLQALEMSDDEQRERMEAMQDRISEYTIHKWAKDFFVELLSAVNKDKSRPNTLDSSQMRTLVSDYKKAENRLILLDYDGTLKNFVKSPDPKLARPTARVKNILKKLNKDDKNKVMIVSGRTKLTLELFFKDIGLGLIAEHGGWIFEAGDWVKSTVTSKKWKKQVMPVLQQYASRTPGVKIEEKDFAVVWHYRQVSPDLAYVRNEDLKRELRDILPSEVDVFEGQKILEIKPKSMHKGALVTEMLTTKMWDFILVIGDDYTDEDMFDVVPERAYTVHVGRDKTEARFQVDGVPDVIDLIDNLSEVGKKLNTK